MLEKFNHRQNIKRNEASVILSQIMIKSRTIGLKGIILNLRKTIPIEKAIKALKSGSKVPCIRMWFFSNFSQTSMLKNFISVCMKIFYYLSDTIGLTKRD